MKNEKKKKVTNKAEKSKKKERSSGGSPQDKGKKWQEFLQRHSRGQKKEL